MDGNKKLLQTIFAILVFAFNASWADAAAGRCSALKKAETPQEGQALYSLQECRDDALERVVSLLPEGQKEAEVSNFLKNADPLSIRARYLLLSIQLESAPEKSLRAV